MLKNTKIESPTNAILIVDDDSAQRKLVQDILQSTEYKLDLHEAESGEQALQILDNISIDVALIDKCMPIMDGNELVREIRKKRQLELLPIIMLTGSNTSKDLDLSFEAGVNDFVSKPYRSVELLARLRGALRNKRLTDQLENVDTLLFTVARMVEAKDETTGDHCSRLAFLGRQFGKELGLPEESILNLVRGAILHDIGKLGIPDSILLKNGKLNANEWDIMKSHTLIGAHLCESLSSMKQVLPIILSHHEKWDGSGYPNGLAGDEIPFLARVFQVIDVYDALSSVRPYKPRLTNDKIIEIMEDQTANGHHDPSLVKKFLNLLRKNPESLRIPKRYKNMRDEDVFQAITRRERINLKHI